MIIFWSYLRKSWIGRNYFQSFVVVGMRTEVEGADGILAATHFTFFIPGRNNPQTQLGMQLDHILLNKMDLLWTLQKFTVLDQGYMALTWKAFRIAVISFNFSR